MFRLRSHFKRKQKSFLIRNEIVNAFTILLNLPPCMQPFQYNSKIIESKTMMLVKKKLLKKICSRKMINKCEWAAHDNWRQFDEDFLVFEFYSGFEHAIFTMSKIGKKFQPVLIIGKV